VIFLPEPKEVQPVRHYEEQRREDLNWNLTTTSTTADQSIGSRIIEAKWTYVMQAILIEVYLTTPSATAALMGTITVRWGTQAICGPFTAVNPTSSAPFGFVIPLPLGHELYGDGSTTINAVCTPAAVTSMSWRVCIIGYEKSRLLMEDDVGETHGEIRLIEPVKPDAIVFTGDIWDNRENRPNRKRSRERE
jgi:hypothetical protein